jgi:trans-aconitate methyltransferase
VRTQSWHPDRYACNARFVADLALSLVDLLAPQPGERILDLGCGDGLLTEKIAACGCQVVGIDASAEQVKAAAARGLDACLMDAQELAFEEEFDAVFSNAVLHWIAHTDKMLAGVWRALKPGGRFVAELGGHGNVATIETAIRNALERRGIDTAGVEPWHFPTPGAYRGQLARGGFRVRRLSLFPRPTRLPGDIGGWLETFAEAFITLLPQREQRSLIDDVREELRPALCDAEGRWTADYVRLRFAAQKLE